MCVYYWQRGLWIKYIFQIIPNPWLIIIIPSMVSKNYEQLRTNLVSVRCVQLVWALAFHLLHPISKKKTKLRQEKDKSFSTKNGWIFKSISILWSSHTGGGKRKRRGERIDNFQLHNYIPWLYGLQNQYKTSCYLDQKPLTSPIPNAHWWPASPI